MKPTLKNSLIGDITAKIKRGSKNPLECLNAAFQQMEAKELLPTKIIMNDKTFQTLANLDPDNMVIYPDEESECGWGVWYASIKINDKTPDNKFILLVEYEINDRLEERTNRDCPD